MPTPLTVEVLETRIAQNQLILEEASKGIIANLMKEAGNIQPHHLDAIREAKGNIKSLATVKGRIDANKTPDEVKTYIMTQLAYAAEQCVNLRQTLYDQHELAQFAAILREFYL